MRIDREQGGWAIASLAIFGAALALYLAEVWSSPEGARGGTAIGLVLGIVGLGFMIYAAALGARKRVPTWRLGRAKAWMRGHLWLGLLSLPLILFHGGFHFGGTLTRVLMWLLIITVASGVYGALLQNSIPKKMTEDVPLETIYDEIGHVREQLREEADRTVQAICGDLGLAKGNDEAGQRAGGFTALRPIAAGAAVAPATGIVLLSEAQSAPLRAFYLNEVRPFVERPRLRGQRLADGARASSVFTNLRTVLPAGAHAAVKDLEEICEEARQLLEQERLHRWLHGWLLLHIPISLALILLGAVHALVALRW